MIFVDSNGHFAGRSTLEVMTPDQALRRWRA
jgi:hypothetical protein